MELDCSNLEFVSDWSNNLSNWPRARFEKAVQGLTQWPATMEPSTGVTLTGAAREHCLDRYRGAGTVVFLFWHAASGAHRFGGLNFERRYGPPLQFQARSTTADGKYMMQNICCADLNCRWNSTARVSNLFVSDWSNDVCNWPRGRFEIAVQGLTQWTMEPSTGVTQTGAGRERCLVRC